MSKFYVKITLLKSKIGRIPKHRSIITGLGLSKINGFVILEYTNAIKGMIRKISYLLKIEDYGSNNVFK
ncbi:MAG TPA: 50S ribosomal protein L30 [Candidatus Azoamicus sp. OHIO1]